MDISGVKFNKRFGQNFITDTNLLNAIVSDAKIQKSDKVLEIGAGAGTLTARLAIYASKVVAYEIDTSLEGILTKNLQEYENVELKFEDFLKRKDKLDFSEYKVVANLPYYITTPIIFELLESDSLPQSLTIMVQKEVGERLAAKVGTQEYGAITASVALVGNVKITRTVKRELFVPRPNVDSCIVHIDVCKKFENVDRRKYLKVVKTAFAMRRKTMVNNMVANLTMTRQRAEEILAKFNISLLARGETIGIEQLVAISKEI